MQWSAAFKTRGRAALGRRRPNYEYRADTAGDHQMIFRHFLGLFCAAAMSAALAGNAAAEDKVVKIGAVFPMTGGAASAGVHAKYAIETALDIINNAHPELGDLPLARNAG